MSTACSRGQENQLMILCGADQPELYMPLLEGKRVAVMANQTSLVGKAHLVDTLISMGANVKYIFSAEHGFRGNEADGSLINDGKDLRTGLPIISLYGQNRKPSAAQLSGIDIVVFDVQDVGVRFYTFISSMHYLMEACAENNKELLVLDRPNPNGNYIDGPVLEKGFESFVGMHPIPVVHGCTIGELAQMINGEKWLANGIQTRLEIVKVANYTHTTIYIPPVRPSPNLPNYLSIRLYPSLCFFEATSVSVGRGTLFPFQGLGFPDSICGSFSFTPQPLKGMEINPLQQDKLCFGDELRELKETPPFTLSFFITWLHKFKNKEEFLTRSHWFNLLMGNDQVLKLILQGKDEAGIRKSWEAELARYDVIRQKYLLYPDFKTAK